MVLERNPKDLALVLTDRCEANARDAMGNSTLCHAIINGLALLSMLDGASASPLAVGSELLSLVPPGAEIVAGMAWGQQVNYLVITRNNTADFFDLESIFGVDPTRSVHCVIVVAASSDRGFVSEHSLVASGHFDSRHIFSAAVENGAKRGDYQGIPVLSIPPLERDKGILDDVRWLAVIDSHIAVFGTIPMVQEELTRYLSRSPVDGSLIKRLSRLRSDDQSWFLFNSAAHRNEMVRRQLAPLDPVLAQPEHANYEFVLGIHFAKRVEIEYENISGTANTDNDHSQTLPKVSHSIPPEASQLGSELLGKSDIDLHKVIRLSKKQYSQFIAQGQARELTYVEQRSSP
jgi:hypothetical protein